MKLKERIKNWLFKEEIQEIKKIKDDLGWFIVETKKDYERSLDCVHKAQVNYDKAYTLLEDCRKFMNSVCDVGTDIGFRSNDHSWAVICVHGKKDFIKFVDMHQSDVRTIVSFLKNFEYSNRVTDSPLGFQEYLEDDILHW